MVKIVLCIFYHDLKRKKILSFTFQPEEQTLGGSRVRLESPRVPLGTEDTCSQAAFLKNVTDTRVHPRRGQLAAGPAGPPGRRRVLGTWEKAPGVGVEAASSCSHLPPPLQAKHVTPWTTRQRGRGLVTGLDALLLD